MRTLHAIREEPWGRIVYDPAYDEFEAHLTSENANPCSLRPISAGCLITRNCNLRCPHCYSDVEGLPSDSLSKDDWSNAFHKLRDFGLMRVDISGGEPTTRRDLESILRSAINAGLNVVLSTNGMLLAARGMQGIPQSVRLHISLDSGSAAIHEANRRFVSGKASTNSFRDVSTLLRNCVDSGYRVRVLTAIGRHNASDLMLLGENIAACGVQEWNLSHVLRAGRAFQEHKLLWEVDQIQIEHQVAEMQRVFPWITIRYSNRTETSGYFLLVLPDGSVATQVDGIRDKVPFGKLFEMRLVDFAESEVFFPAKHFKKWIARTLIDQPKGWEDVASFASAA